MFDFSSNNSSTSGSPNYSPYLTLLGGGWNAMSDIQAGNATARLQRANAALAGMQARGENEAGAEQAELYRQHLNARIGQQAAARGASGVTASGSALRSLATTAELGAQDIARIQTNASRKAWGYEVQQEGDLARAGLAQQQGWMSGIGSLITSGARAYGQWGQLNA